MKRQPTITLRILRATAAVTVGSLLALSAGAARADDPYPPLDDEAQRVLDDAREQMYAIDFQRRLDKERRVARADAGSVPAQEPQLDTLDPSLASD